METRDVGGSPKTTPIPPATYDVPVTVGGACCPVFNVIGAFREILFFIFERERKR